jgi:fimbrial chaperone protein
MTQLIRSRAALAAALFLAAALPGVAGTFRVSPIRVELSAQQSTAVVTINNGGEEAVVVQLQMYGWSQQDGNDVYQPTTELIATPPIATIKPGGAQIVRIGLRRSIDPERELAYRLYLQEIPTPPKPDFKGLQVALRIGLPIFVQPQSKAAPVLRWQVEAASKDQVRVTLRNEGNAHVQVTDFNLSVPGREQPLASQQVAAYVLAGQSHQWTLPVDPARTPDATLRLLAHTDSGNVDTEVPVESKP